MLKQYKVLGNNWGGIMTSIRTSIFFAAVYFLATTSNADAATVTFGCDASPPDKCYFSILYATGGRRNFTMNAGERDQISGVEPGRDRYMVMINRRPPNNYSECTTSGNWCKRAKVKEGYNN